jgi:predicted nucleic acid-binding protein
MLVVDASAVAELLLRRPSGARVAEFVRRSDGDLHAPHLIDVEVLSTLRRLVLSGVATVERADQALEDFTDLPIERYPHDILVTRAWRLRDNFSAYDAVYVALAEVVTDGGAPLVTADRPLASAARRHTELEVLLAEQNHPE